MNQHMSSLKISTSTAEFGLQYFVALLSSIGPKPKHRVHCISRDVTATRGFMDMGTIIPIVCFLIVGATYDWDFRQPRFG